jgi:hypothetical protein
LLSFPKIKSGHVDGAGRLIRVLLKCFLIAERPDRAIHSCSEPNV